MKAERIQIIIMPGERMLEAYAGDSLYTVLLVNNILNQGEDAVRLEKGSVSAAEQPELEEARFSTTELLEGWMLASQRFLTGDAEIYVPEQFAEPEPEPVVEEARPKGLGMAVDLGSGVIVAGIANFDKLVFPRCSAFNNSQCQILGDLGARIQYIREQEDGLAQLQALLWNDLREVTLHLSTKTGHSPADILSIVVAANPLLEQILWGEMPELGRSEGAAWSDLRHKAAAETPLAELLPQAQIQLLPAIAADLGSDVVAGILATGLEQKIAQDQVTFLVDIGLNTEIVAAGRGRLVAASVSTAALEGVGLACGMRATTGAIIGVEMADDVSLRTMRDAKPRGVCGAGLISAAYVLLQHGLLNEEGRILLPQQPPPLLAAHFSGGLGGAVFTLSHRADEQDIYIEQNDIRQLQIAKGSVYAACLALMQELDVTEAELGQIMIAESFQHNIDPQAALAIGLLPQVELEKVKNVGNVSWQGAYLCLGNQSLWSSAQKVAEQVERLDLATNMDYAEEFMAAMNFEELVEIDI